MLDQKSGLRAYALTGDDRFLEAYEQARGTMESLDDEPLPRTGQLGRLHLDMRLAQSAWMERWVPQALGLGSAGGEPDDQEDEPPPQDTERPEEGRGGKRWVGT